MRHFVGLLSGLIVGPVLVLASGWAFSHLQNLHRSGLGVLEGSGPVAAAGLLAVGVLVALMAVPARLTPMLPLSAALVLVGLSALALVRMHLLERLPHVPGTEGALVLLPLGVFVPVAVVLLAPVLVGGRWRRQEDPVTEEEYFEGLYGEDEQDSAPRSGRAGTAQGGGRHAASPWN